MILNLLLVLFTFGQTGSTDTLGRLSIVPAVDSLQVIENVYLQTDRSCYYPGEDIWFKAYLVEASDRLLTKHSGNLHVELISPASKIIRSFIAKLDDGMGNGDFKLPETLESGTYRIRAYTNYMRNFGDRFFFTKEIVVINPSDTPNAKKNTVKFVENTVFLSFYPEGGSLLDNVSSVVAFKAVNSIGKGCDVEGSIYSSNGEQITTFRSDHLGMGTFFLRPLSGISYFAQAKDSAGFVTRSEIPKSFSTGITLGASVNGTGGLTITTKTNAQSLPLFRDKDLILTLATYSAKIRNIVFKINSYNNNLNLPLKDLPDGIIKITLSTAQELPLSERLIFIQKDEDLGITIEPDKKVYQKRDSVALEIFFSKGNAMPQDAYLSLSAAEKNFSDPTSVYPTTIASWFFLESDLRGPLEDPSYYFDPSNPNRLRDLNVLLLTQGWRDFKWKYDKPNHFLPEHGFTISGRVRNEFANKPLNVTKVNIGIVEDGKNLLTTAPVDELGQFRLDGIDLTGEASLIVSALNKKGDPKGLIQMDTLRYIPEEVSIKEQGMIVLQKEDATGFAKDYQLKEKVLNQFKLSDTISLGEINVYAQRRKDFQTLKVENNRMHYDKPDNAIVITSKYAGYPNIFEIIRGRFAGVQVNGFAPSYDVVIRGFNSKDLTHFPLFLIDGVKKTYEYMLQFPVGLIERIDVLKSAGTTAGYGAEASNGVISVITRTGDIASIPKNVTNHSGNTKMTGYDSPRIFFSPMHYHVRMPEFDPDLRTTLLWEPNISLKSNKYLYLKYFNSDLSTTIRVMIEGITSTGIPITATTEYEVK